MPKYILESNSISLEDQDQIGQIFSRNSLLTNQPGVKFNNGFFITYTAFELQYSDLLTRLKNLQSNFTEFSDNVSQVKALQKLVASENHIDKTLENEIKKKLNKLKSPFRIQAITKTSDDKETTTFDFVVANKTEALRAIPYAWNSFINLTTQKGQNLDKTLVCLYISEKKPAEVSGKAFIFGGGDGLIEIQSMWGEFNPTQKSDVLKLNKKTLAESSYTITPQSSQLILKDGKLTKLAISEKFQNERKLSPSLAEALAKPLENIQNRVLTSIEVDFDIADSKTYITGINLNVDTKIASDNNQITITLPKIGDLTPLVPGIASGFARLIENPKDLVKLKPGEIALLKSFNKTYLPTLKKASGIIIQNSQKFTQTAQPAIQKLGISSAVGLIKDLPKQLLTLDAKGGKIYLGGFGPLKGTTLEPVTKEPSVAPTKTATKIFLNLNQPETNFDFHQFDGIGPIQPETFFKRFAVYPWAFNKTNFNQVKNEISQHIEQLSKNNFDKPIIYQISDFKSSDLVHLDKVVGKETPETNPFIGKRGAQRHLENPEVIKAEFSLIQSLRDKGGVKNLWVSLPFIRTTSELIELKKIFTSCGLRRSPSLKLFVTLATPANVYEIDSFIEEGIDGGLINYYDLTNLLYGRDFSYEDLIRLDDKAILEAIGQIVKSLSKAKLFSGIYNFPIYSKQKLLSKLVGLGIKSVSVSENDITQTRAEIATVESDLVIKNTN